MNLPAVRTARAIAAMTMLCAAAATAMAQTPTTKIVTAATTFLSTLDQSQRARVLFDFDDAQQRTRWSNFPTSMSRRAGLKLGELTATQRSAALALLSASLSPRGYEKVQQIMEADEVLKTSERNNPLFGRELYYLSILGTPSATTPWMLQFGGHHLALNITIAGEHGVLTPSLTGAQPALYTVNGITVRPLGQESDKAFALLNALNPRQQKKAILDYRVADLVLGPGQDIKTIQPEGLAATDMTETQRAKLLDLIGEWTGIVHTSAASARMAEISAGIGQTWFAWSGPTTVGAGRNGTAYYRIQGPTVVIEYAPQGQRGDASMHVHTMYRDPTNDYGRRLTAQ